MDYLAHSAGEHSKEQSYGDHVEHVTEKAVRAAEEVTDLWYKHRMVPNKCKVFNPAFDVTPHYLISAIVTEKGIFRPSELKKLFNS